MRYLNSIAVHARSTFTSRVMRDDKGAASVELGLVTPLYLVVILFIVEMARLAFAQIAVSYAAEEATRFALVNFTATTEQIEEYAQSRLIGLDANNLTGVFALAPLNPDDQTRLVTVRVEYLYAPLFTLDGFFEHGSPFVTISLVGSSRGFLTEEIGTPVS